MKQQKQSNTASEHSRTWEIKKLGDIAVFTQGIQVGLEKQETNPKNGYVRFIRIVDYTQNTDDIRYIPNPGEKYFVNELDIVMVRYGTPGLIGRGKAGVIANNLFQIKISANNLSNDYLALYLTQEHIQNYLSTQGSATMPALNFGQLKIVEISYPPLPEQQRIVAYLDETFAKLNQAKANIQRCLSLSKHLFESELNRIFTEKGEDWEERTLGEVTTKIGSGATPKGGNSSYKSIGISLVRSMNVHDFNFKEKNLAFIDEKQAKELSNVTLEENDVLLNITGASVARCCVIPKDFLPARVNQHVSIIRAKNEIVNSSFLNLLLTSKFYKDQLLFTGEQGATRQAITKAQLEIFKVSFPKSLQTQQLIVSKLDALSAHTKQLEALYTQKLANIEELKQGILKRAFEPPLIEA